MHKRTRRIAATSESFEPKSRTTGRNSFGHPGVRISKSGYGFMICHEGVQLPVLIPFEPAFRILCCDCKFASIIYGCRISPYDKARKWKKKSGWGEFVSLVNIDMPQGVKWGLVTPRLPRKLPRSVKLLSKSVSSHGVLFVP